MPYSLPATREETAPEKVIDNLSGFLRSEIAAVETYDRAFILLEECHFCHVSDLVANRHCHRQRIELISTMIRQLGGTSETTAGIWEGFARTVARGAAPLSVRTIIAALEDGEKKMVMQYRHHGELDASSTQLLRSVLVSRQNCSRERLRLCTPMGD